MVCVLSSSGADADGEPVTRNCGGIAGAAGLAATGCGRSLDRLRRCRRLVDLRLRLRSRLRRRSGFCRKADASVFDLHALADVERCRRRRARSFDRRGRRIGESQIQRAHSHAAPRIGLACRCCRRDSGLRGRFCSDGRSSRLCDHRRCRLRRRRLRRELESRRCFAVSEVVFSAAGFSGVDFAFTTPEAADFAIAASAAGVNDGGSHVNSSRPSVGATAVFAAGAGLAAFAAGAFAASRVPRSARWSRSQCSQPSWLQAEAAPDSALASQPAEQQQA